MEWEASECFEKECLRFGYTYPDGKQVSRTYTPTGALETLHFDGNLIDTRVYDGLGRMTRSTFGNGVVTDHSYRADNRLASIQVNDGNGNSMDSLAYSWDANKNLTHETRTGVMSGYGFTAGYDAEDRLTSWNQSGASNNQSWNLSPVGDWNSVQENGQTQSRHHGPTHELLSVSQQGTPQAVSHDAKGNMTVIPSSLRPDALELTLAWDFDNRMHTAANDNTIVSQRFDALGRRVGRDDGTNNQVFLQVGQQTVADYASDASPSSPSYTYIYGSYIDEPVLRSSSSGDRYYHRGQQYSITALTDGAGSIVERYAYTAYGTPTITDAAGTIRTASSENNRYTYTGREYDEAISIYHYRARMYDPSAGRFCSRDPIGFRDGWSLYNAYFYLKGMDPLGLEYTSGGYTYGTTWYGRFYRYQTDCEAPKTWSKTWTFKTLALDCKCGDTVERSREISLELAGALGSLANDALLGEDLEKTKEIGVGLTITDVIGIQCNLGGKLGSGTRQVRIAPRIKVEIEYQVCKQTYEYQTSGTRWQWNPHTNSWFKQTWYKWNSWYSDTDYNLLDLNIVTDQVTIKDNKGTCDCD